MSISNEIERIADAKKSLRDVIASRGVQIDDNALISEYPDFADALPFVMKGTFTPESDVVTFEMKDLDFTPEVLLLGCAELGANAVDCGVFIAYLNKKQYGNISFWKNGENTAASVKPTSSIINWGASSVRVSIPASNNARFLKGYTYSSKVMGGKA